MPSQTVITLQAQLAMVDAQINLLLQSPTPLATPPGALTTTPSPLLDHSLDGQSFQLNANLERLFDLKEKIEVRLRKNQPYESITRTLLT